MNNRNVFWGVLLVFTGSLFLAYNLHWVDLDLSLRQIAKFWPLLFILAGVSAIVSQKHSVVTPIMIALAIPLALFHFVDDKVHRVSEAFSDNFNFDDDDDKQDSTSSKESIKQEYVVDFANDIKEANLDLKGGAAKFDLQTINDKLFIANTELTHGNYTLTQDKKDGIQTIDFEMKGKKNGENSFNFDNNENISNQVHLKLNPKTVWNLDMGIGAGALNFDLSSFIVKKINIETGAAAVELKISDKAEQTDIKVQSGVASVKINVPLNVGCQIKSTGALSSTDFEGFNKVGDAYQTPGFDKSTKKIYIDAESGLSSLEVSRY